MARKKSESIRVRMTTSDFRSLKQIMTNAGLEDTSETVRFCVSFTTMMLSIVPESAGEALIAVLEEDLSQPEDT